MGSPSIEAVTLGGDAGHKATSPATLGAAHHDDHEQEHEHEHGDAEAPRNADLGVEDELADAHVDGEDETTGVDGALRPDEALSSVLASRPGTIACEVATSREPDDSLTSRELGDSTSRGLGVSLLSKSALGVSVVSPLRQELQKGMEKAAQEMSQTVRRAHADTQLAHPITLTLSVSPSPPLSPSPNPLLVIVPHLSCFSLLSWATLSGCLTAQSAATGQESAQVGSCQVEGRARSCSKSEKGIRRAERDGGDDKEAAGESSASAARRGNPSGVEG